MLVDQYLEAFFALEKRLSMSDVWSCEDPRPREAALKHGEREHEKLLQKFKGRRVEVDLGNGYTASDVVFEDGSALTDDTQRRARYHAAQAMSRPETPKRRYDRQHRVLIPLNLNPNTPS